MKSLLAHIALLAASAALPVIGVSRSSLADEAGPKLGKYEKPVDEAVDKALAYLAKQQLADGSFPGGIGKTAVAGLALMAFLAKGHGPGNGPYGVTIDKIVDFLLTTQRPNGYFESSNTPNGAMYEHCIVTLAISEVSGMVEPERQKRIDATLPKALRLILTAQTVKKNGAHQGGWRYAATSNDSDISCSGWALMALRSARNAGAPVPKEAIDDAVKFFLACRLPNGGFAYQPGGGANPARTGTGLLCLELSGRHGDAATIAAGDWMLKNMLGYGQETFFYGLYYCSQSMFQLGGSYWETWAEHMYTMMLPKQGADGSWPPGGAQEGQAGPCYSTAMAVLALGVTYRQLPIYQR